MTHSTALLDSTSHWEAVPQFCERYRISPSTWWRWAKKPGFPCPVRFGSAVRWNNTEVEAFLLRQGEAK